MAGGTVKYRHLSRDSSARMALLRGLVTQLVHYEHIQTTHAKAKETQRMAEKLITLAKKNNEPCRRSAQGILYTPHLYMDKLFGELRQRYQNREGGYTRVVRTEPRNNYDQAETSILELVDGPKDSRFMMTAKTVARDRLLGRQTTPVTAVNIKKVTQFRGEGPFEEMVKRFMMRSTEEPDEPDEPTLAEKVSNLEEEASMIAARESQKTADIGASIVPESYKRTENKA